MAAKFAFTDAATGHTLPGLSIAGNDPTKDLAGRAGDIVHTRNGQTISVRSWADTRKWTLVVPLVDETEIDTLRTFWVARAFELWPLGTSGVIYDVFWVGGFNPVYIGPDKYSLEITLEEQV